MKNVTTPLMKRKMEAAEIPIATLVVIGVLSDSAEEEEEAVGAGEPEGFVDGERVWNSPESGGSVGSLNLDIRMVEGVGSVLTVSTRIVEGKRSEESAFPRPKVEGVSVDFSVVTTAPG